MKIKCDIRRCTFTESGTISAPFFVEHRGMFFPDNGWYELIVSMVDEWGLQIRRLIEYGKKSQVQFDFHEGIFGMVCHLDGAEMHVQFWNDIYERRGKIAEFDCSIYGFIKSYIDCAESLLEWFEENEKNNTQIQWAEIVMHRISDNILIINNLNEDLKSAS